MSVASDWTGDEWDYYDKVVKVLLENPALLQSKLAEGADTLSIMDEISVMAVRAVENRTNLW